MSTTVTYKGDTLTTVNNNTKTLKTAGKYMEDDIVLVDTAAEGSQENNPIRFFDYDGTIVASYTEVPESLPPNPTHEGLTAQGWNWTLEDIATQFESTGACDIGQMYVTDDGKTRIYITVSDQTKSFWLGLAPNGTLSIDWGDGSEVSSMTGTSLTTLTTVYHSYKTAGSYTISIEVESGNFAFYSNDTSRTRLFNKYKSGSGPFNYSYDGCVTAIELGNNVQISTSAFAQLFNMIYITIPNTITSIDGNTFNSCYTLKSITIPNKVTNINGSAFEHCYALRSVIIPNSVTNITGNTFNSCYALESIIVPNSVIFIGSYTFQNCYALKSIIIPDSLTNINSYTFSGCYALESITIPDSLTNINAYAFNNCYALKSVTIPDGVTHIGSAIFQYCYALKSITIPNSVTSIDSSAFQNCYALESIIIPNNVTNIAYSQFQYCYALKSITIPDSVTKIDSYAFAYCSNMEEYHFLSTTPPTLTNTNVFSSIPSDCKIYVPYSEDHSVLNAYKTATNWSTYADYIVEEGE